jgi:hypothetical protein
MSVFGAVAWGYRPIAEFVATKGAPLGGLLKGARSGNSGHALGYSNLMSKVDFFISYNQADEDFAEWVAATLEEAGYTTRIQKWDFRPGNNFVMAMDAAAKESRRTIAVLSPDYLAAAFPGPEWAAHFAKDPTGVEARLVPVRVRECHVEGLLKQIVRIDLVGKSESDAKIALLEGVRPGRAKPERKPAFPNESPRPSWPMRSSPRHDAEALRLIEQLQSRSHSLAHCVAAALRFAIEADHSEMRRFCERELRGIREKSLDKRAADFPKHRCYSEYISYGEELNPGYFGWGGSATAAMAYVEREFQKMAQVEVRSIGEIESASTAKPNTVRTIRRRAGDLVPDTVHPDVPVFCYSRWDTEQQILEATRSELTRILTDSLSRPDGETGI